MMDSYKEAQEVDFSKDSSDIRITKGKLSNQIKNEIVFHSLGEALIGIQSENIDEFKDATRYIKCMCVTKDQGLKDLLLNEPFVQILYERIHELERVEDIMLVVETITALCLTNIFIPQPELMELANELILTTEHVTNENDTLFSTFIEFLTSILVQETIPYLSIDVITKLYDVFGDENTMCTSKSIIEFCFRVMFISSIFKCEIDRNERQAEESEAISDALDDLLRFAIGIVSHESDICPEQRARLFYKMLKLHALPVPFEYDENDIKSLNDEEVVEVVEEKVVIDNSDDDSDDDSKIAFRAFLKIASFSEPIVVKYVFKVILFLNDTKLIGKRVGYNIYLHIKAENSPALRRALDLFILFLHQEEKNECYLYFLDRKEYTDVIMPKIIGYVLNGTSAISKTAGEALSLILMKYPVYLDCLELWKPVDGSSSDSYELGRAISRILTKHDSQSVFTASALEEFFTFFKKACPADVDQWIEYCEVNGIKEALDENIESIEQGNDSDEIYRDVHDDIFGIDS